MAYKKKLIEVALPLEAINKEAAREKSIRHGHPSTMHLWWARRPLAACRAVLWASLVDDPSSLPEQFPTEEAQNRERERLFRILERLVLWENSNNEEVLAEARAEIMKSTGGNPPPVLDPFCGGGSIPLEAQRLGLEAHASDLNPVAVLITKALIEIPPKFANMPPVNPEDRARGMGAQWKGAAGLAADVRYYGKWMRDEAEKRIGHLYPKVMLPPEHGSGEATVIAWLWARTVTCPNPACGARMPLVRSFWLSTKAGRKAWVEPIVDRDAKTVRFQVRSGEGMPRDGTVTRRGATCLFCSTPVSFDQIRTEGRRGGIGVQPLATVVELRGGRVYVSLGHDAVNQAPAPEPSWTPDFEMAINAFSVRPPIYGLPTFSQLFTRRQLVALSTYADLVKEAEQRIADDAAAAGMSGPSNHTNRLSTTKGYARAVRTYLALGLSRLTDISNSLCRWESTKSQVRNLFTRQIIPMLWDFAEANVFAGAAGDYWVSLSNLVKAVEVLPSSGRSFAYPQDAAGSTLPESRVMISTDPPYYNNIDYADISDFFYVWLRYMLTDVYPELFQTVLVPKSAELVATPYRFGGSREKAKSFFEEGLGRAFRQIVSSQDPSFPLTVFYAFKQVESEENTGHSDELPDLASTGWETMLEGLMRAGLCITGTWPARSELDNRILASGKNALASSVILVCRLRPTDAPLATRREFVMTLKRELPDALHRLQQGSVAPVDLAQAAIGPGMAVYSRYAKVLEPDGSRLTVRTALQLINQALDEVLTEQEGEYDNETRWAIAWFEQFAMDEGQFGQADVLARAKGTAVNALVEAGIVWAQGGKVRLLRRDELPDDWSPHADRRLTVWELTQHLIRALDTQGEEPAARMLAQVGALGETARDLAYRLYATCERKKWAQEALAYNSLVVAWPELSRLAAQVATTMPAQERLL